MAGRTPAHDLVVLRNYQVGRHPDRAGVVSVEPCYVAPNGDIEKFSFGDTVRVSDLWAYTADTAYHLGDAKSYPSWGRFHRGPLLNGPHVVRHGELPQAVIERGYHRLPSPAWPVLDFRPLVSGDVTHLALTGVFPRPGQETNSSGLARLS